MPLTKEIEAVMQATSDLAKSNRAARAYGRSRVEVFIESADLYECQVVINMLIERVSDLTGCAKKLEDAESDLARTIETQEAANIPPLCSICNGSGQGQDEGTVCWRCKGKGSV